MNQFRKEFKGSVDLKGLSPFRATGTDTVDNLNALVLDRFGKLWELPLPALGGGGGTPVSGGVVETTYTEVTSTLIPNEELIPGTVYKITGVDSALYEGNNTIYLTAATPSTFFKEGIGEFYNPIYPDVVGCNIFDYNANSANLFPIDNYVIWGGRQWKNITGLYGSSLNNATLDGNWEKVVDFDDNSNLYVKVFDSIRYSIAYDSIYTRLENDNNINVTFNVIKYYNTESLHPIQMMQWGNTKRVIPDGKSFTSLGNENIMVNGSYLPVVNSRGSITNLYIENTNVNTFDLGSGSYAGNIFIDNCSSVIITIGNSAEIDGMTAIKSSINNLVINDFSQLYETYFENAIVQFVVLLPGNYADYIQIISGQLRNIEIDGVLEYVEVTSNSYFEDIQFTGSITNIYISKNSRFGRITDNSGNYSIDGIYVTEQATYHFGFAALSADLFDVRLPKLLGWASYGSSVHLTGNPLVISEGTTGTITLDGLANTIKTHLPTGISDFFDTTTNKILPVKSGDGFAYSLGFKARNNNVNGKGSLYIDIGNGNRVFERNLGVPRGANTETPFYFSTIGYELDTFLANGGVLKISAETGTIELYDISLQIHKISHAN